MPIQRSGGCDQRRRRVLMEEHLHAGEGGVESGCGGVSEEVPETVRLPGRRYGAEAAADHQQPLTAMVPKRAFTLILLLISGFALIAAVQALYGHVSKSPHDHWLRAAASLDVESAGGLASWCSSLFLLAAAVQGIQIYRLRRHRSDDYRGRYRVWIWVSPLLLAASLTVGTHLHHDLLAVAAARSQVVASLEPRILLTILPVALWLLVALRLLWEVRESRAAWTALVCASLSLMSALVIGLLAPTELFSLPKALTISSLNMVGHLTILMTVASYSRHVYLDAHGLLASRPKVEKKPPRKRSARRKTTVSETAATPAAAATKKKQGAAAAVADPGFEQEKDTEVPESVSSTVRLDSSRKPVVAEQAPPPPGNQSADIDSEEGGEAGGLSKSERRRQKKLKRREASRSAA